MIKLVTILGARPQFVKMAALHRELQRRDCFSNVIIHTGQHYDTNMSDIFFRELKIPKADINLGIGGGTHGQNTGRMIEAIETQLLKNRPDWVVVFGDTDSTLAGAIAASKLNIKIAHIESGLRSFNRKMPEEINRILTDHCSDLLFAPTELAKAQLLYEGVCKDQIIFSGDIMYDVKIIVEGLIDNVEEYIMDLGFKPKQYVLATIHRSENTSSRNKMMELINCLSMIPYPVLLPLHPRTRLKFEEFELKLPSNIVCMGPLGYFDMFKLESKAVFIITDSGGVQKEAYFHKVPCITLRTETEWVELVQSGVNWIVGSDVAKVKDALIKIDEEKYRFEDGLYGYGHTSKVICDQLLKRFTKENDCKPG